MIERIQLKRFMKNIVHNVIFALISPYIPLVSQASSIYPKYHQTHRGPFGLCMQQLNLRHDYAAHDEGLCSAHW